MDNSFFIRSKEPKIEIQKFQICSWEFKNNSSLIEFGIEIKNTSIQTHKELTLYLYIPWLENGIIVEDFYSKLKQAENSRFIFNDSVENTTHLDGGQGTQGVVHQFSGKDKLCILPVEIEKNFASKKIQLKVNLEEYQQKAEGINAYIRIAVKRSSGGIATSKKGIGKSTIIYDVKLNERRNIPKQLISEFRNNSTCEIDSCFCFHIIPNRFSITFLESEHLKTVRTLEFNPFKKYLDDSRIKKDELMVVFSKKPKSESYSFFSIFTEERIGVSQFAMAVLINIICGFLFAVPTIRKTIPTEITSTKELITSIPIEISIAFILAFGMLIYFFIPSLIKCLNWTKAGIMSIIKK